MRNLFPFVSSYELGLRHVHPWETNQGWCEVIKEFWWTDRWASVKKLLCLVCTRWKLRKLQVREALFRETRHLDLLNEAHFLVDVTSTWVFSGHWVLPCSVQISTQLPVCWIMVYPEGKKNRTNTLWPNYKINSKWHNFVDEMKLTLQLKGAILHVEKVLTQKWEKWAKRTI